MKCLVLISFRGSAARTVGIVLVALTAYGCEGDDSTSSPAPPGNSPALAWEQQAATLQAVNSYTFTAVVDGAPAGRLAAACTATSAATTFTCSAPLPVMPAGTHTLAVTTTDSSGASSPASNSVSFTVPSTARSTSASMTALAESAVLSLATVCVGEGQVRTCYQLNRTATGLNAPADPTEMPGGRIVVLDQGLPLEVAQGRVRPVPADTRRESRIADLSVPPDGEATREVYALEVTDGASSRVVDVVRFRDVGGVLGQRAVIVPGISLPEDGDPALLVDKDLLIAVPRQGDGGNAGPGLILRYDRSGRPAGRSIASPALAWGPGRPSVLMPMGDKLAAAGVAPGPFVFGALTADGTTPISMPVTQFLAASGGVRSVARIGQLMLLAAGDGSAYVSAANADGEPTSVQRVDTHGAFVTGLAATRRGSIIVTAHLPIDGAPGRVYELIPVQDPSRR